MTKLYSCHGLYIISECPKVITKISRCGNMDFAATISRSWFEEIAKCIRFVNLDIRQERRECDKLVPFLTIWDLFFSQCKKNFSSYPSEKDAHSVNIYIQGQEILHESFLRVDCNTKYINEEIKYTDKGADGKKIVTGIQGS